MCVREIVMDASIDNAEKLKRASAIASIIFALLKEACGHLLVVERFTIKRDRAALVDSGIAYCVLRIARPQSHNSHKRLTYLRIRA